MLLAMRHLQRLKYRKIGLALLQGFDRSTIHSWEGAFLYGQEKVTPSLRVPALLTKSIDRQTFVRWFREHRPDAVISSHLVVRDWLLELGLGMPEDVGFI